ncbi:sodium transport ATPase [Lineolata rhizophorae]|uniref:Sodium/potassium exporting P-type ATPase 1 n=1 Tax=Lineolata rhizophorae TaxID=578093 RepID=A0A6A6P9Q6_9PEZI|nr:sodium transport ATPase [Lineolata rhizophorae]
MGIEEAQLNVEESTEPPIPSSPDASARRDHLGLAPSVKEASAAAAAGAAAFSADHSAAAAAGGSSRNSTLEGTAVGSSSATVHREWEEEYKHAHTLTVEETTDLLGTDVQNGLSSAEATSRFQRDGPNKVKGAKGLSVWEILLRQVSNSLTLVLVITMALSYGINDYIEGGVITAVILLNIVVGFVQDYHAEKTIESLYALAAPVSKVIRDGRIDSIKAETLVVGDVVLLAVGDIIPADLRLFDGINASAEEALLTGESVPVSKTPQLTFTDRDMPIGDRTNMAWCGSTVAQGRATGIVVSTGMRTEMGKIAELLRNSNDKIDASNKVVYAWKLFVSNLKKILGLVGTPLQVKLSKFALLLFALAILLALIVFSANKWDIEGEVLIYGICVGVAVIPESLIAVLTITVAVGTKAMAKGNVIVRKLQALEAVGGVTNICSDKTGTLTQGKMVARKVWIPGSGVLTVNDTQNPFDPGSGYVDTDDWTGSEIVREDARMQTFLNAIALCNLATVFDENALPQPPGGGGNAEHGGASSPTSTAWTAHGEPTEIALQVLAMRFGRGKAELLGNGDRELAAEFGFDSSIKRMTVVYRQRASGSTTTTEAYMKGAAEVILPLLTVSPAEAERIRARVERMAGEGLRVLCVAHRVLARDGAAPDEKMSDRDAVERHLDFVGLVGLYDPPRVETADAVRKCQVAGITVHMLTGDHVGTATAIAREVGILDGAGAKAPVAARSAATAVMPAEQFDKLSDEEIDRVDPLPLVIARCSPMTKVRMVEAMHRRNAYCVMTGDGVNDSPALKRAHVGIAMGMNGSDVAKEAADMVLTDDNFASIVKAVEEGRRLFDNIQKFLMHLLISNISQVILLLIGLAFKDADGDSIFPLAPLEILWVNLITSSFLAIGLGLEEAQPDIMLRPPHDPRVGVFTRELITDKMLYGSFMGGLCLAAFASVAYGAGGGDLGEGCNEGFGASCETVFRARATAYATLTYLLLVTAWEVKHFARSIFALDPAFASGPWAVFPTLWRNRFLFWAVVAGAAVAFPVVYLPVVNREVFKHAAIGWEWGVVAGCVVVYTAGVEAWKAVKRRCGIGSGRVGVVSVEEAVVRAGLVEEGGGAGGWEK